MNKFTEWLLTQDLEFIQEISVNGRLPTCYAECVNTPITLEELKALDERFNNAD
jgi:hypothetical protein